MSISRSEILAQVLDLPESERAAAIERLAVGNPDLKGELSELVSSYSQASGFFDQLAQNVGLPHVELPNVGLPDTSLPPMSTPPKDPQAFVGQRISRYVITDYLGGGGMGSVYKANDEQLEREVALKFLPETMGADAVAKERFLREARSASALDHPNICTVFEIGDDGGKSYIAMAYYSGSTIEHLVERGPLEVELAVKLAQEMCAGLGAAHAKGIIHRDIKPANVILADGVTKILDFGLAKSENSAAMTQEGMVLGTAAYMSPEQATGAAIDHRTDVWSTGAVLYEMLSGSRPFPGAYPQAILYGILNADPEPLSALRPGLPMQLVDVVDRALKKDPDQRFGSMTEMKEALQAIVDRQHAKSAAREMMAAAPEPVPSLESAPEVDEDILHILCVDDEPELELLMQQRFRKKLRAGEWKFTFALDGMDALQKLEANPDIGVILTDLNMPRMDGLTLLDKLSEMDRPMRTVVVSAYGDMDKIRTAMNRGAFDFVTKPVDFQDLETTTLKAADDLAAFRKALRSQQQAISIQQEMDVARRIQDAIIPAALPTPDGWKLYGFSAPAADVSGTFYDAFDLEDGRIGLLMGDVGGRGVTAALLMAMGQTFVKSFLQRGESPSACLEQLNSMLFADGLPHVGLRMLAGVIDTTNGEISLANAGHTAPWVLKSDGSLDRSEESGSSIWERAEGGFKEQSVTLGAGDALVIVSSGMLKTANMSGAAYSNERMAASLRDAPDSRPTSLIRHVVRSVQDHAGDQDPREDLTMLAIRRD
jgi:serine/threonine protein kinase/serine phosphatase RsbU (regulator of sigma subunit)